jgi:hypothetical protein
MRSPVWVIFDRSSRFGLPVDVRFALKATLAGLLLHPDLLLVAERGRNLLCRPTRRRLRRGVFRSIVDLQATINRSIVEHNTAPKPFVWTADPERVLTAVKSGKQALESAH